MIKLVCFDLDGVLVDSTDWHYRAFNAAMQQVTGKDYVSQEEHFSEFNGIPTYKKVEKLIATGRINPEQGNELAELKSDFFKKLVEKYMKPDPDKIEIVSSLKQKGIKVYVVSNCNHINTTLLLLRLGIIDEVDRFISSSDVKDPKPSPEGYQKAMKEAGVHTSETVIFEDSPVGLTAARASNAHFIQVEDVAQVTPVFVMSHLSLLEAI